MATQKPPSKPAISPDSSNVHPSKPKNVSGTKSRIWSERSISARELRKACFHEAGHVILLNLYGGYGEASVWRNANRAPDEMAWRGRTRIYEYAGAMQALDDDTHEFFETPPERWRVMFGMAGYVAECIQSGNRDPGVIGDELGMALEDEVSQTDKAAIGVDWTYEDVEATVDFLVRHWADVKKEAAILRAEALKT